MKNRLYELEICVRAAARRYPLMLPLDAVKLVYQNEFGCGHMLGCRADSLSRLRDEMSTPAPDVLPPLFEDIGNGYSRLNLAAARGLLTPELVNGMLHAGAVRDGDSDSFAAKLGVVRSLSGEGVFGFTQEDFDDCLRRYAADGSPLVSHTEVYRRAYSPSYRVADSRFTPILEVVGRIDSLLRSRGGAVVAFDGMSASGKTTAAALTGKLFDASVVHTDDFFLPTELRVPERLSLPGGSIHHERLRGEVISKLRGGREFSYHVFDCGSMAISGEVSVEPKPLVVVEGAYSLHPSLGSYFDLGVFFEIDADEQARRIIARNGEAVYERFRDIYIPMENAFFDFFNIRAACALTVRATEGPSYE